MGDEFEELYNAIITYDKERAISAAKKIAEEEDDIIKAIEECLVRGAKDVGEKFDRLEIFLPELLMAADAMQAALNILLPKIPRGKVPKKGVVVSGTVKGDIHDIGKNILVAMLRANGFEVYDLGVDVPTSKFIEEAERVQADIITLSALMASTLGGQKDVIDYLKATGKRDKFIVMVGGGPTTREWAEEIGADGYAETASEAVKVALELIKKKRGE
ncbi:MAG: corrinoid protein [Candidatus Aenigmatarchaeota archaeon]